MYGKGVLTAVSIVAALVSVGCNSGTPQSGRWVPNPGVGGRGSGMMWVPEQQATSTAAQQAQTKRSSGHWERRSTAGGRDNGMVWVP